MNKYNFKAIVSIADFVETDPELVLSLFKRRFRTELGPSIKSDVDYTEIKIDIDTQGDNDILTFKGIIVSNLRDSEETVDRKLRKILTTTVNRFVELDLESVANKIDYLEVQN